VPWKDSDTCPVVSTEPGRQSFTGPRQCVPRKKGCNKVRPCNKNRPCFQQQLEPSFDKPHFTCFLVQDPLRQSRWVVLCRSVPSFLSSTSVCIVLSVSHLRSQAVQSAERAALRQYATYLIFLADCKCECAQQAGAIRIRAPLDLSIHPRLHLVSSRRFPSSNLTLLFSPCSTRPLAFVSFNNTRLVQYFIFSTSSHFW
jgi:hypothetical protein